MKMRVYIRHDPVKGIDEQQSLKDTSEWMMDKQYPGMRQLGSIPLIPLVPPPQNHSPSQIGERYYQPTQQGYLQETYPYREYSQEDRNSNANEIGSPQPGTPHGYLQRRGQNQSGMGGPPGGPGDQKRTKVFPTTRCKLKLLKMTAERSNVDDLRGTPMNVGSLEEIIDDDHAIVSISTGPDHYVSIMSFVDKDLLEPGCAVLLHHKAPTESYADVGGLEQQIQEIKEAVELPLTHPELYEEMGIKPPKGVILYGVPGTGKTLLAKAVANQTSATFLRVVGSELIQKYLGDGPKLVRELFRVAEDHAPSIVFIDEIDAIGTKRYDSTSGGEREIQRTMLELLNQLDGFDSRGRIDRKIEFPLPDVKTKRRIFNIHTGRMTLSSDVDLEEFVMAKDDLSGADIKAVCTEAGLLALRERV
ncbi:hypothetical protein BSLG_005819 [Batrachochytrium salamandrivorans]|nr:hypothetical protein BSLG_005819 [Batrachochytrium salamandrivorans]